MTTTGDIEAPADGEAARGTEPRPTPLTLFLIFARIGLTSFGGGISGWLYREFVQDRAWITEDDFLNGLSISQALPGMNVTNMAIWIGYRLLGGAGAIASFCGIIGPPAVTIVLIGISFTYLTRYPITEVALTGAAAASIGLSLSMGISAALKLPRSVFSIAAAVATFAAVGLFHLPLHWVVLAMGSVSVAYEYARIRKSEAEDGAAS